MVQLGWLLTDEEGQVVVKNRHPHPVNRGQVLVEAEGIVGFNAIIQLKENLAAKFINQANQALNEIPDERVKATIRRTIGHVNAVIGNANDVTITGSVVDSNTRSLVAPGTGGRGGASIPSRDVLPTLSVTPGRKPISII